MQARRPVRAFVALGSNLDDPVQQIARGVRAIAALPHTKLVAVSSLYRSAPVGYREQPDFHNAVVAIDTALPPRALLGHLLEIERAQGRVREFPNAPRTLDLDIVLYGNRALDEPGLTIPHPRMHERAFVIVPLAEIAPGADVPARGDVTRLLRSVDRGSVERLPQSVAPRCAP